MKKYFIFALIIGALIMPRLGLAATSAEIQAQINAIMAQIQVLQQQVTQLRAQQGITAVWCHDFNVNLKIGDSGVEVEALQMALSKENFQIDESQFAKGNFEESTASAVTGFQQKYKDEILTPLGLKYGTGFVGKATRAKLNKLYGCGVTPTPIPPIPTCNVSITCVVGSTVYDTGEKDSNSCPIKRCLPPTQNQPPVISGVSGPTTLKVNETGTWTVKASDPEQGVLTYQVFWGDEAVGTSAQLSIFTHSYASARVYNPTFQVTDNQGLLAKTSISVNIGETTITPSITVLSPNGGEQLTIGLTYTFRWSTNGNIGPVDISIIDINEGRSSALQSLTVATGIPNTGSYTAVIPTDLTYFSTEQRFGLSNYKVRLSGVCNSCANTEIQRVVDESDQTLVLRKSTTQPSISYITPTSATVGSTVMIYGTNFDQYSFVALDNVRISGIIDGYPVKVATAPGVTALAFVLPTNTNIGSHTVQIGENGSTLLSNSVTLNVVASGTLAPSGQYSASILENMKMTLDQIQKAINDLYR